MGTHISIYLTRNKKCLPKMRFLILFASMTSLVAFARAGSVLDHLEKGGNSILDCVSYMKPRSDLKGLLTNFVSSCGCTASASSLVCRDLEVHPQPTPCWSYSMSCKETATAGCKTSVEELAKVWIKRPEDEDECLWCWIRIQNMEYSCR